MVPGSTTLLSRLSTVNQPAAAPEPSCGALRKQSAPNIAYFVIDRTTSKGHRSIDESLNEFTKLTAKR